jgi:hypothetical protein
MWDSDGELKAGVYFDALPVDEDDVRELVELLMGRHELSGEVLRGVKPGTVPDDMGAKQLIYLVFGSVPESDGRPFTGGIYAVQQWVTDLLDRAMPNGWGAAVTQPMLLLLVADEDGILEASDLFGYLGAQDAGRRTASGAIISPMERAKTGPITGNVIRDFDAPAGTPTLLPLN